MGRAGRSSALTDAKKFPRKCPCFAGHPALLSPSLLILCSPWGTFGKEENRTAGEGQLEPHRALKHHISTYPELLLLKTHLMGFT